MKKYSAVTVMLAPMYIATDEKTSTLAPIYIEADEDVKTIRTLKFIIRLPDATGLDCMNALYNAVIRWKQKMHLGPVDMTHVMDKLINDPIFEPYLEEEGIVTISIDSEHIYPNPGVYYSEMKI